MHRSKCYGTASRLNTRPDPRQRPLLSERKNPIRRALFGSLEAVDFTAIEWVHGFNGSRLPEPIGTTPLSEAKTRCDLHSSAHNVA
jgi:hypothetical protein